jgi:macrolide transport system ATP-binding/permease protein
MLSDLLIRIRSLFLRRAVEGELDEELRFHLEHQVEKYIRSGLTPEEAMRRTRIEFGGLNQVKEHCREARGVTFVETLSQDVRYGLRMLRKSPGFTAVALVTLALGIGANAVVISLVDALVFKPMNVRRGQNLYTIGQAKGGFPSQSYPDYVDLRDRNHSFDGVLACEISTAGLDTDGKPAPIWLYTASGNYFDVLGVQPFLGRFFHATDEHGPNSAPYIVLSYAYWFSHFQGDRGVVGRVVRLNKHPYTILGVAPQGFRGTELFYSPDLWAPIVNQLEIEGTSDLESRGSRGRWVVGRLKAGVTPAQATADLSSVAAWMAKAYPKDDEGIGFSLARPGLAGDMLGKPVHAFVAGLMLLSGMILLAACANLGSLFSARAEDRSREVALRLALGSSRGRIVRQLLTEAVLVSLAGGALGLTVSVVLLRGLSAWQPLPDIPIMLAVSPDAHTYVVAFLLALASGLLFGMVPVRQVLRSDPYLGIKAGAGSALGGLRIRLRDVLLAGQIAVCAVLVTSSLVAVRGMLRSLQSNFGFVPQNTLQVLTDLNMAGYKAEQSGTIQRRMLDAVSSIPGVSAAAFADRIPLNLGWSTNVVFEDRATDYKLASAAAEAMEYFVSPGYFQAAETTLVRGRAFTWNDGKDAPHVAVVNQEFARKVFGSESKAVGSFFKIWNGTRVQVVGVAEDGKYATLSESPTPAMFLPILQSPSNRTYFLVRSNRSPQDLAPELERVLHELDAGMPLTINPWERELGTALFAARAASIALGVLGVLGAMLAITGIFGMAAYSVSKRLRELGIRIALGAQRKEVLWAALGRVFRLLSLGSAVGLLLGMAATKLLSFIVYQATPRDPLVLAGVVITMLLLGLLAAWIPAQRAMGADPLILLREE